MSWQSQVGTNWPSAQTTCFSTISWTSRDCLARRPGCARWKNEFGNGFPNVTILGTAGLLERLSSEQHLSAERASDFQWKMFRQGYRGSSLRGTLRWLMFNVPLRSEFPIPYQYLVDALSQAGTGSRPGKEQYARVSFCAPPS